jgi:hypothetical protein
MVVAFRLGQGSNHVRFVGSNQFISGLEHYMGYKVFGLLRVNFMYGFCIGFVLLIVLWDNAHAVYFQLLACKNLDCDGVEAQ